MYKITNALFHHPFILKLLNSGFHLQGGLFLLFFLGRCTSNQMPNKLHRERRLAHQFECVDIYPLFFSSGGNSSRR